MSQPSGPTPERGFDPGEGADGPVIRDKRRIDPTTGTVREPAQHAPAPEAGTDDVLPPAHDDVDARVLELTSDVQRLSAEYANYRRRVDRDRELVREAAVATVLAEFLPVLDDLDRARDHGDLTGAFKSVGESVETTVGKLGLERYGEVGEPFDPTVHEALMHDYSDEVDEAVCTAVLQPGYRFGGRVVRPARVAVTEPSPIV